MRGAQGEGIEMDALPAHGDLDYAMELAERKTRRHQNAPPHHRADPGQPEFDLQDCGGVTKDFSSEPGDFGRRLIRPDYRLSAGPSPDTPEILMLSSAAGFITEAANHTIGGARPFYLHHRPLARLINSVQVLRHDTISRPMAGLAEAIASPD
jgi:hypothetical protein